MSRTIFYSWQSDINDNHNRNFIKNVLETILSEEGQDNYSLDFNLDRDTSGLSGTPEIADSILEKIQNSEVFVCDVTIINSNTELKENDIVETDKKEQIFRKTPNPNVMLELGYAAGKIGWENIVCVFNKAYGNIEELPFDLRHRRIAVYELDKSNWKKSDKEADRLGKILKAQLAASNVEQLENKRRIEEEFRNENSFIRKLALNQPYNWEYKLTSELLKVKGWEVQYKLELIEQGAYYNPPNNQSNTIKWIQDHTQEMLVLIDSFPPLIDEVLVKSVHESDPIRIRRAVLRIIEFADNMLEWKLKIEATDMKSGIKQSLQQLTDSVTPIVFEIFKIQLQFEYMYLNDGDSHPELVTQNNYTKPVGGYSELLVWLVKLRRDIVGGKRK